MCLSGRGKMRDLSKYFAQQQQPLNAHFEVPRASLAIVMNCTQMQAGSTLTFAENYSAATGGLP